MHIQECYKIRFIEQSGPSIVPEKWTAAFRVPGIFLDSIAATMSRTLGLETLPLTSEALESFWADRIVRSSRTTSTGLRASLKSPSVELQMAYPVFRHSELGIYHAWPDFAGLCDAFQGTAQRPEAKWLYTAARSYRERSSTLANMLLLARTSFAAVTGAGLEVRA